MLLTFLSPEKALKALLVTNDLGHDLTNLGK